MSARSWFALALGMSCALCASIVGIGLFALITAEPSSQVTYNAAIAADGSRVFYDTLEGGVRNIVMRRLDDWDAPAMVVAKDALNPVFSRDGKQLFFERAKPNRTEIWCCDDKFQDLKMVAAIDRCFTIRDVDQTGQRVILQTLIWKGGMAVFPRQYLMDVPEGTLSSETLGADACFVKDGIVAAPLCCGELRWIDHAGKEQPLGIQGSAVRSSQDGQKLLYCRDETSRTRAWKVWNFTTKQSTPVDRLESPVFDATGEHLIGLSPRFTWNVWEQNCQDRGIRPLVHLPGYIPFLQSSSGGVAAIASDPAQTLFTYVNGKVQMLPTRPLPTVLSAP